MKEKRSYGKGYLKGYEAGLNDAWNELIHLTTKGYSGREIRIVANTKRDEVGIKVLRVKSGLESELGIPLEDIVPGRTIDGVSPQDIRPGTMYLVESKDLSKGVLLFSALVDGEEDGISITRVTQEEMRGFYSIPGRTIWLTRAELKLNQNSSAVKEHVSPTELPKLNSTIRSFINTAEGRVVLLEGIDYLILNNSMEQVRKFLNSIKDEVYLAKAVMLICLDPTRMKTEDISTLRNEVGLSV